jgi:hypothetical protein
MGSNDPYLAKPSRRSLVNYRTVILSAVLERPGSTQKRIAPETITSAKHATAQAERRKIVSRFKLRNLPRASAEPHQIQHRLIGIRMPENAVK